MGCDYYIIKILRVSYLDNEDKENEISIELDRERCYFNEYSDTDIDSDDSEYFRRNTESTNDFFTNFYKRYGHYLDVKYEPRILYTTDTKWKNETIQEKYEHRVLEEIGDGLLIKVTKEEVRFFR